MRDLNFPHYKQVVCLSDDLPLSDHYMLCKYITKPHCPPEMCAILMHQLKLEYNIKVEHSHTYRKELLRGLQGVTLTQGHQAAIVLQHHIPVEQLLDNVQVLPLLPGEVHSDVLK